MFKKSLLVGLCVLTSIIVNSGVVKAEKLKVGTNAEYAPFEFYDEKNNMVGFDIDLTEAVAKKAGYEGVEWVDMKFDGLIMSLQEKKFDMIAAGLVVTKERLQKVNFTKTYADEALVIVVKKNINNIKTLKDLENKKIGAEISTTSADVAKTIKDAKVTELDTVNVFLALVENKVDAIIQTESVAKYSIVKGKLPLKLTSQNVLDKSKTNQIAFAINKKNKTLLAKIEKALEEVKKDGTFDKISQKWFGKI